MKKLKMTLHVSDEGYVQLMEQFKVSGLDEFYEIERIKKIHFNPTFYEKIKIRFRWRWNNLKKKLKWI